MKDSRKLVLGLVLASAGLIVVLSWILPSSTYPPYSTYSTAANGHKALYMLLEKLEFEVNRIHKLIPTEGQGTMILFGSHNMTKGEATKLRQWVKRGNQLVLVTDQANPLTEEFNIDWDQGVLSGKQTVRSTHPLLKDVFQVELSQAGVLERKAGLGEKDKSIVDLGSADEFLWIIQEGGGQVVVVTDTRVFTNRQLAKADNLILLLNILRNQPSKQIWFNELVNGMSKTEMARKSMAGPLGLVLVQLAIAVLVLFYYLGKRFGRPVPIPAAQQGIMGDLVSSMATLFRQGKARRLILENIWQGFRNDMTKFLGVPVSTENHILVKLFSQRISAENTTKLKELVEVCEGQVLNPTLSESEMFTLVRELELWRRKNMELGGEGSKESGGK